MKQKYFHRFFNAPNSSFFLFGPRGTGKSTWISKHYKNALWIDFLDPESIRRYKSRPERLREVIDANKDKCVIVLDEIQRVPEVLTVVHSIIEKKENKQFILTGSSARKLKKAGVDLLAGRAVIRHMHPFMASELDGAFDLNKALRIGLLPLVLDSAIPKDVLAAYATTYLQEEVQAEGLVRNIGNFARFLEIVSFSHGSLLNVTNISKECEVERKTISSYISILEDLLLSFCVPIFTKRAKRKLSAHPKFYLFDSGVFHSLRPRGPLDNQDEMNGAALEGLVAQHLRAFLAYSNREGKLYFWRTKNGVEVDFVLYGPDLFVAIEVKNATKVSSKDVNHLKSFIEDYPEAKPLLLYRGNERIMVDNILCIPCEEFFLGLHPEKKIID